MRKGFTLVELLIVIVIIGILAAAMLLSSGSAAASAEASNIINGLRSLKTSVVLFVADHPDYLNGATAPAPGSVFSQTAAPVLVPNDPDGRSVWQVLQAHMDNPAHLARYSVAIHTDGTWWAGYTFPAGGNHIEVQRRLQPRAASMGLYIAMIDKDTMATTLGDYAAPNNEVFMLAR